MRNSKVLSPDAAAAELVPEYYFAPVDFTHVFERDAPTEVDLGCGDGSFLVALAEQNPGRNFLGIERMPGRVRTACRKIARRGLKNARILRVEIAYAAQHLLPAQSIDVFHVMFPDPWPKRRHARRRIVTKELLESIHAALVANGSLRVATDQGEYFEEVRTLLALMPQRFALANHNDVADFPVSTFENRFREGGIGIHRLVARKLSEVR